jgi:hypothetical protein
LHEQFQLIKRPISFGAYEQHMLRLLLLLCLLRMLLLLCLLYSWRLLYML